MILFRELERAFLIPCEHQDYIYLTFGKKGGGGVLKWSPDTEVKTLKY
jgi:hypothetical protein